MMWPVVDWLLGVLTTYHPAGLLLLPAYVGCYIYFANNVLPYIEKMNIPDSWYIDEEDYHNNMCVIRAKENIGINKRINDIENWAENLPDITDVIFGYLFVKEGINV